ncbi:unnamed protein product [marine sediment metagenome]|uniref:Uncharacterized protein n=1 Tax=marine sediment metagenome TaxID=412755 RepID=X1B8U9_9ZZZZ
MSNLIQNKMNYYIKVDHDRGFEEVKKNMSYKKVDDFKLPGKKDQKIHFINFGSAGESYIVHIKDWDVYEMPALKKEWRSTLFIKDIENRGIRINSSGFQLLLEPFWGKKASLVIRRWIPKDDQGALINSATRYGLNQLDPKELWMYDHLTKDV